MRQQVNLFINVSPLPTCQYKLVEPKLYHREKIKGFHRREIPTTPTFFRGHWEEVLLGGRSSVPLARVALGLEGTKRRVIGKVVGVC